MASQFSFEAIGTHWQIDIYEALSSEEESALIYIVKERVELFEAAYSRFRPDSLVAKIAKTAGEYVLPDDAEALLSLYHELYMLTGGLFTPFMGQVLVDAGYDAQYSLKQARALTSPPQWQEVMEYNPPLLRVKKPFLFDFGAAGKGYIIDIVAELIQKQGIVAFCIDAGGDILHRNTTALRVGLEHPGDPTKVIGVVELLNKSLCGSAGNRRVWQNFHHIINPYKLSSPKNILAVWVMADTTFLADALTTCIFLGQHSILANYNFEYLLIRDDYSIEHSKGFENVIL
jgi:thiamine biosynthesis lipoprotein